MNKIRYSNFFLGLIFLIFSSFSFALDIDVNHKRFKHITAIDGLSGSYAVQILKDSRGYLWIGTDNGLSRYDGYNIDTFIKGEGESNSLSDNYVADLVEDSMGNLWVATNNGLNKFNPINESITSYFLNAETNKFWDNKINVLHFKDKDLWVGTEKGLYIFNLLEETFELVLADLPVIDINIHKNYFWVSSSAGLHKIHKETKETKTFEYKDKIIYSILLVKNSLWCGTQNGLIKFDLSTEKITNMRWLLPDRHVVDLEADELGNVWLGTVFKGLYVYSLKDEKLRKVGATDFDSFYFVSDNINDIYYENNHLWIGSEKGVSYTSLDDSLQVIRTSGNRLIGNSVQAISMGPNRTLWVGTDRGVTQYFEGGIRHYENVGFVNVVLVEGQDVWAAGEKGVFRFDWNNYVFVDYTQKVPEFVSLGFHHISDPVVLDMVSVSQTEYIMALPYGILFWDAEKGESERFRIEGEESHLVNIFQTLFVDGEVLIVGSNYGMHYLDLKTKSMAPYVVSEQPTLLDKASILTIMKGDFDYIWAGTSEGVFKLKERKIISRYTKKNALPDNKTVAILMIDGVLWVATEKGLAAFSVGDDRFQRLYLNESNFNLAFNIGAAYRSEENILYFGNEQGLLYFEAEDFVKTIAPPRTVITNFHLFNKKVSAGSGLLQKAIGFADELILKHNQNMVTFEFSSLNYSDPNHLYAFQMQGLTDSDDGWLYTDAKNRRATFTPSPGKYIFRVKSGWDKAVFSEEYTELKLTILPPWWRTTYAYAVYILILILGIVSIIRIRTHQLRKQAVVLRKEVSERTEEIQGLLDKKNELFANVSHELRTPLSLILGPADRGINREDSEVSKKDFQLIKRSGQRLQALVEQLLLFSKLSHYESLEAKLHSVKNVTQVICASIQSLMEENELTLVVDDIPDAWVKLTPEDALQTLLINLLSNAAKYSPAGGQIKLSIKQVNDEQIQISVRDSGSGIPEDWQAKIFERFSRMPQHAKSNIPGTGLGLSMVKDLVEMNGGYISVSNALNGGAVFTVVLPAYQATLEEKEKEQIVETIILESVQQVSLASSSDSNLDVIVSDDRPSILIIDDTPDMRAYLFSELGKEFNVFMAEDGESGLQSIRHYGPDLIICDVMMPGIDGFEVLKQLRADINISHIPLILLTAKDGKENRMKGFEERADDYIVKPFAMDELKARVNNFLELRKLWQKQAQSAITNPQDSQHTLIQNYADSEKRFLEKFKTLLEKRYSDPELSVEDISKEMHVSPSVLTRKIRALLGTSPYHYLRVYRLEKSIYLLKSGYQGSMRQLAEEMGFASQQYFNNSFKKHFGVSPKDY